ncbi:MAG: hypothetical protein Q8L75_10215, partial [Acidobacteriota bacterium]|nr:hypothetical protein [Acidobacteriota bacterium]
MTRQFAWIIATLTGIIGLLVGVILSTPRLPVPGSEAGLDASGAGVSTLQARGDAESGPAGAGTGERFSPGPVNFADIAARLNPAVVNIDA